MKQALLAPGLRLEIAEDSEAMSGRAAAIIIASLKERPQLLLCASAGGTPTGTYRRLVDYHSRHAELFACLRVLQIDEWLGLAAGSPESCHADLCRKLVDPLGMEAKRFIAFRTDAGSPEAECGRVMSWLARHGPIDLCILGLGLNGHIAMNEPGEAVVPHAHVARLTPSSRRHAMLRRLDRKPKYGLTLGLKDILQSRKVLLLATGSPKREALGRLLTARVTTRFPASFLWLHPDATILCDQKAAPR